MFYLYNSTYGYSQIFSRRSLEGFLINPQRVTTLIPGASIEWIALTIKVQDAGESRRPVYTLLQPSCDKGREDQSTSLFHIAGSDLYIVHVPAVDAGAAIHAEVKAQADRIARFDPQHRQVDL